MYNKYSTSYTEDKGTLYLTLGVIGISLISYSEPIENYKGVNKNNYEQTLSFSNSLDVEKELTDHAMLLSQTSLVEDWKDEDNANWESYL